MAKHSSEAHKFLKSLTVLFAVLIFAFAIFYHAGPEEKVSDGVYDPDVIAKLMEKRKQMRRSLSRMKAPNSEAFMTITVKPVKNNSGSTVQKTKKPPTKPSEIDTKITSSFDSPEGLDRDIQNAIESIDKGNIEEALSLLEAVLQKDPGNEQALIEVAMIHLLDLKQTDQAVAYLERVMVVNPDNRIVMTELVSLYSDMENGQSGLSFLSDLQSKHPESPEIAYGIGQLLLSEGREAEAISQFEKATQGEEERGLAFANLAESYARIGDMEKAFKAYNQAIDEQESDIENRRSEGLPINFDRERLGYLKADYADQLIKDGQLDRARKVLNELDDILPGDETIMALKDKLKSKG